MISKWTTEKAWAWHEAQPWLRGCNFLPSDCCNRVALWQELDFEQHLATTDREFELAARTGFNSMRVILEFIVWDEQHDGFMERFERFVATAAKHGISLMVCFANDCVVPKDENYKPLKLGPQHYDLGYHGGRKNSPHSGYTHTAGYNPVLDEPETAERFYAMVTEIVAKYADDPRIVIWDLFNEPGNGNRGEVSVPHVERIFGAARAASPSQPLTTGAWRGVGNWTPAELLALELSDVISFHNYGGLDDHVLIIDELRKYNRPLFNTEWLNRMITGQVAAVFPLFYLEKIGCWNWGLVNGLSQTHEPYEGMWREYEESGAAYDFTKWMHDLFRINLRPYDPREIKLIKKYCDLADRRFAEKQSK